MNSKRGMWLGGQVLGTLSGPPLMLLNGPDETGFSWAWLFPALVPPWRIYAPELRSHGRGQRPGCYSLELMRDDVIDWLDAFHLDGVTMAGCSIGGILACLIAEEQPGRIARLVLKDPVPSPPPEHIAPGHPPVSPYFDWADAPTLRRQLADPDPAWRARLTEIAAPTLVIGGQASHVPLDKLAAMAGRIPDCRLITIPAGHEADERLPAELTAALAAFLRGTRADSQPLTRKRTARLQRQYSYT